MPLSGTFLADFASFTDACAKAEVSLKGFESGSAKVEGQLNKMSDSFSGRKIIQEATQMAEVFQRGGGAAGFTEKELARMGATGAEAAAKLKALGQDVPPGIARIAEEVRKTDTASQGLGATVKDLAISYVAFSTVQGIVNYARGIVSAAGDLKDLSTQTHINVEELQLLAGGMSEFGVDAATLGNALYKLSRGIAGGDESVTGGLHLMGMSLKDVEGLQGKELFLKIESGLATLQGGLRDTAAAELFGGKLGAAMAGASEGIQGSLDKWQEFNTVMSGDAVDAMDQYDESIKQATASLNAMAGQVIGKSAQTFNVLTDAVTKGAGAWSTFWALTKDVAAQLTLTGTGTENMARLLDELNQKADHNAAANREAAGGHAAVTAAVDTRTAAEKFMAALEADAAIKLTTSQIADLEHLKEIGALNAKNAEGIGVNAAQFHKYTEGIEAAKKAVTDLAAAQTKADTLAMTGYQGHLANLQAMEAQRAKSYGTAEQLAMLDQLDKAEQALARSVYAQLTSETERMKVIIDSGKQHQAVLTAKMALETTLLGITNKAVTDELAARERMNAAQGLTVTGTKLEQTAFDVLQTTLQRLSATRVEGISQAAQIAEAEKTYTDRLREEAIAIDKTTGAYAAQNQALEENIKLIMAGKAPIAAAAPAGPTPDWYAQPVQGPFGTGGGGPTYTSGLGPTLGNASGGGRNGSLYGGPPSVFFHMDKGGPVGDDGPAILHRDEYVVPKGGALVMRESGGGGIAAGAIVINLYGTPAELASQVEAIVTRKVLQGRKV